MAVLTNRQKEIAASLAEGLSESHIQTLVVASGSRYGQQIMALAKEIKAAALSNGKEKDANV